METENLNDYQKGKVKLKAKTCLQRVNPLIPEMRLTGS